MWLVLIVVITMLLIIAACSVYYSMSVTQSTPTEDSNSTSISAKQAMTADAMKANPLKDQLAVKNDLMPKTENGLPKIEQN